jgi:hypothetical protein
MRPPSELAVQLRIVKRLEERGAYVVRQHRARVGVADLLVCYRGLFLAPETKRPGWVASDVRPMQHHEMDRVRRAGGLSRVVATDEDVRMLLDLADSRL